MIRKNFSKGLLMPSHLVPSRKKRQKQLQVSISYPGRKLSNVPATCNSKRRANTPLPIFFSLQIHWNACLATRPTVEDNWSLKFCQGLDLKELKETPLNLSVKLGRSSKQRLWRKPGKCGFALKYSTRSQRNTKNIPLSLQNMKTASITTFESSEKELKML